MDVPVTGIVILAVAAWVFLFAPRHLYGAMIIAIPFSATAIINISWAGAPYGAEKSIIAWQLFAVLWISREAFSPLPQWHRRGWFLTGRARFWLFVFLAAVVASLCVPIVLNGTSRVEAWILSAEYEYRGRTVIPLRFTFYNLTQSAYLVFGVLITIFVAAKNWNPARLLYTLKLYVASCVFAAAWGLFQLWCQLTGHIYPASVFNTGKNPSTAGYTEIMNLGNLSFGRISSVATEPSVLAQELLVAFVVLIACLGLRRRILARGWNWFGILLIGTALLLSTSTTAYFGFFAALLFAGIALARAGSRHWKHYLAVALLVLAAGAVLAKEVALVETLLRIHVLGKYQTFSGVSRLNSNKYAVQAFLRYPVFGTGWGTVNGGGPVYLILASTGLVGGIAFAAFALPIFRGLWRLTASGSFPAAVLLPAIVLWLVLVEGDDFSIPIGYNWLFLGLAAGAVAAARAEDSLRIPTAGMALNCSTS